MLTLEKFKKAQKILDPILNKTNLIYSKYFTRTTGNNIYLKPENMQVTGSYKVRGSYFKINSLSKEQQEKGLITASAGNHAQGVAYAAQLKGIKATIVMPTTTPLMKVNNTKSYGAEVVLEGSYFDEAYAHALKLSEEFGYTLIPPFNDLDIATGQGTIAYEILKDLPDVDIILVPIGGGGLAAGVATLAKLLNPNVHIIGVEPKGAACMYESLENKCITSISKVETIADGVAVQTPGDLVFPYVEKNVDEIILIDDNELIDSFLDTMENHRMIVENAGLLSIAALKHLKVKNKNVVSVLSGGNMDVITISSLVAHGLINRGRIFTFSVLLPDRPGELLNIAKVIAEERGNIIQLEHNQFVSVNRNSAVELQVTLEAFGHHHTDAIMKALKDHGYDPTEVRTTGTHLL